MTVKLKLDWCSHKAAKYAVEHWHYSQCMPVGKLVKIGVWENNIFIGVVLFSRGANKNMLKPYGLRQIDGCELTRVALKEHISHVSRIISIALRLLKLKCKTMQLVVSYADTTQGHIGGIYQAGNWIYDFFSKTDQIRYSSSTLLPFLFNAYECCCCVNYLFPYYSKVCFYFYRGVNGAI